MKQNIKSWIKAAEWAVQNQKCGDLPGYLTNNDVPPGWREDAREWTSGASIEEIIERAVSGTFDFGDEKDFEVQKEMCIAALSSLDADSWLEEQGRREEEALDKSSILFDKIQLIAEHLKQFSLKQSSYNSSSYYGRHIVTDEDGDELGEISIRLSDHPQKAGGGWNEQRQEQHGESDVSVVVTVEDDNQDVINDIIQQVKNLEDDIRGENL